MLNFVEFVKNSNLSAVLPAVLAAGTNREREVNSLSELTINEQLSQAAQFKAEDMASRGLFCPHKSRRKNPMVLA